MSQSDKKFDMDSYWKQRTLCSDESCIGVLGADGRCGECGRMHEGYQHKEADADGTDVSRKKPAKRPAVIGKPSPKKKIAKSDFDAYWAERTLCIDESCIGVVGRDGRCKECGLAYSDDSE